MVYQSRRIRGAAALVLVAVAGSTCSPAFAASPDGPSVEQQGQGQLVSGDLSTLGRVSNEGGVVEGAAASVEEATDRLVVDFKDGVSEEQKQRVLDTVAQETALEDPTLVRETAQDTTVVSSDTMMDKGQQQQVVERLEADPAVESVTPDLLITNAAAGFTQSPNDPLFSSRQWNLKNMNVPAAWAQASGRGVTIGIADTGDTWHPDLNPNKVSGYDFVTGAYDRDSNPGRDGNSIDPGVLTRAANWHGTHVAGLAAAAGNNGQGMVGVAPEAKISSARVMGVGASGYVQDFADGITWLSGGRVPGVPANPNPSKVVNFSAAWPSNACPANLKAAIDGAHARNVPVVVSAGNTAADTRFQSPANCLGAIVVGATTSWNAMTSYSNWGAMIDVVAPGGTVGSDIWSTFNDGWSAPGNATYGPMNGTSMASPQVAGVVALMLEKNPGLKVEDVRRILTSTGTPLAGYKKVNAGAAVNATPAAYRPAPAQPQFVLTGAIGEFARKNPQLVGSPTMNERGGLVSGGFYQTFSKNRTVYWTGWAGAHSVYTGGGIGEYFIQKGHENGIGYPVTEETANRDGGAFQEFRKASGQRFRVAWSPASGTHAVYLDGGIGGLWSRMGGEQVMGYPIADEQGGLVQGGAYQVFRKTDGTRYMFIWSPESGTHVIREGTAIFNLWRSMGAEGGSLGYPITEEMPVDGGVVQKFRNASGTVRAVYWSESTGARIVYENGAIGGLWASKGGVNGLGFPIFNETPHPAGTVSQEFKNLKTGKVTVVSWHPRFGTYEIVRGTAIGEAWLAQGGSRGDWGVPVTNEYSLNGRVYQKFSNKVLVYWTADSGVKVVK